MDEAHHARARHNGARRQETQLYKVVRDLVAPEAFSKRAALFLTATPMQLHSRELYSLIELIDPALFPTEDHFDEHQTAVPGLNRLVHNLQVHGFPMPVDHDEAVVERVAEWLELDEGASRRRLEGGPASLAALCEELTELHLLSQVLIRNRKKVVGGFMPRQAHRWEVELSKPERQALAAVEAYVAEGFAQAARTQSAAVGFVMVILQKLMTSSIKALSASLRRRQERLLASSANPVLNKRTTALVQGWQEQVDDDQHISALLSEIGAADANEASELGRLVQLLDEVPVDSKADTLVAQLEELARLQPGVKVLLFTEFRETQEYLKGRLEEIGWEVQLFHGQLKPAAKDASVEAFRTADRPSILLSTEAGGEGRNFQFCHVLVNYDLPWNPMRVEQRIGRVDRIGQTDTVQVFNFWVKDSIEERVLDVLERRIGVFEETVGGLDPILGDTEKDLTKILRLGGQHRDAELERFEAQLEQRLATARRAEEKLRDFIMETKSYSQELARQLSGDGDVVSPAAQELLVTRLLADVNTYIELQPDGTHQLFFHEPFVSDYPQHSKDHLRRRRVALRADVRPDSQDVEYLGLGHPVVDDLVARVTDSAYQGSAAAFEVEAEGQDLPSAAGWLVVHELGVPALKEVRELVSLFVHDDGRVDPDLGATLLERCAGFPEDIALTPADIPVETLDEALVTAETRAYERLATLEAAAKAESDRMRERERDKLVGWFDYRDKAAHDRLVSSMQTLMGLERRDDPDARRILPVWRANVARDERLVEQLVEEREVQLRQLERRANSSGDSRLIAVARVEVLGDE